MSGFKRIFLASCLFISTAFSQQAATLSAEARRRILGLAEQLPQIWNDPRVDSRERKRIVRLLIDDVTLIKSEMVTAHVRMCGGATRTLVLDRPLPIAQIRKFKSAVLYELAAEEGEGAASGVEALVEADAELKALRADIEATEVRTLLSGEYDEREALVTIRSGAGGVDAADWAEMLMRMYIRWAEQHKYNVEVFDTSYAEEAGIKSTTFAVHTQFAYGTLSVEQGTHRLVRISPFDNQNRRQTSFAEVEVLPVVDTTDHIDIPEGDIRVDVYRSSGPGGQSVNTTDSAVRLTHIPTGIVVTCQNEKSQLQNKVSAMRVLQAKLLERKRSEERAELDALKGDGGSSWGNQMRSYVLHPYQMVKDLRTEYEVGNPAAVLDGDIDGFLEAGIRWRNRKDDD